MPAELSMLDALRLANRETAERWKYSGGTVVRVKVTVKVIEEPTKEGN
jgi:hypothetical protein